MPPSHPLRKRESDGRPPLRSLYDRVCKADGSDRELDCLIYAAAIGREARRSVFQPTGEGCWVARNLEEPHDEFVVWIDGDTRDLNIPPTTASLDAITALIERELPGWKISIYGTLAAAQALIVESTTPYGSARRGDSGTLARPMALALTAAFLAACIAKREAENDE